MLGNIGPMQLLILLLIVALLFGTKRIRNLGSDLGSALRGFKKGLNEDEPEPKLEADPVEGDPIESEPVANKQSSNAEQ